MWDARTRVLLGRSAEATTSSTRGPLPDLTAAGWPVGSDGPTECSGDLSPTIIIGTRPPTPRMLN
jgi:hypothetical protein